VNELLTIELWCVIGTGAVVAVAALAIRVGWRRGKRMEDR
jgi:hypothetical protein